MREDRGDDRAAEAAARDALRIEPDNARALNFLGYLMADHDRRLPEAMELIRRALAAEPDNGAFVDSMGWVLFRLGRFDDARVQLERAVDLTGGDPTVREHLGDAYRKLRQPDRAREQYRLAAERDSTNTRLRDKRDAVRP
jgi:Tfp pilus assembly protein PilF